MAYEMSDFNSRIRSKQSRARYSKLRNFAANFVKFAAELCSCKLRCKLRNFRTLQHIRSQILVLEAQWRRRTTRRGYSWHLLPPVINLLFSDGYLAAESSHQLHNHDRTTNSDSSSLLLVPFGCRLISKQFLIDSTPINTNWKK